MSKCKIIFQFSEDNTLTLPSGFSSELINLDTIAEVIIKNRKTFSSFVTQSKKINAQSIKRSSVNLYRDVIGNCTLTMLKESNPDLFEDISDDETPNILLISGIPITSNRSSNMEVTFDKNGNPIYILNRSSKNFMLAKIKLAEHLKLRLMIEKADINQILPPSDFYKIQSSIREANKKLESQIKETQAKLDKAEEGSDEYEQLSKTLNTLRKTIIIVPDNAVLLLQNYILDSGYKKYLSKEQNLLVDNLIQSLLSVYIEYSKKELNDILRAWETINVYHKEKDSSENIKKLSIADASIILNWEDKYKGPDKPKKPRAIKQRKKETPQEFSKRKAEFDLKMVAYLNALALYDKDVETWKANLGKTNKELADALKELVLSKMIYHNFGKARIEVQGGYFIIHSKPSTILEKYPELSYNNIWNQLTYVETHRGFKIYKVKINGLDIYFYDSKNDLVSWETLTTGKRTLEEVEDKIDNLLNKNPMINYSHLYCYVIDRESDMVKIVRDVHLHKKPGTMLELYTLPEEVLLAIGENLDRIMEKGQKEFFLSKSFAEIYDFYYKNAYNKEEFEALIDNDPEKLTIYALVAHSKVRSMVRPLSLAQFDEIKNIVKGIFVLGKTKYIIESAGAKIDMAQNKPNNLKKSWDILREYTLVPEPEEKPSWNESTQKSEAAINVIKTFADAIKTRLGIKTVLITDLDIKDGIYNGIKVDPLAKAFILNGEVVINLSNADLEDACHEYSHLFLEFIKMKNPELYQTLMEQVKEGEILEKRRNGYMDRTRADVIEEVLADKLGIYMRNRASRELFDNLVPPEIKKVESVDLYTGFRYILTELNVKPKGKKWYNADTKNKLIQQRTLSNKIEELIKDKQLQEECRVNWDD